ncbi:MAG: YbaB/EbfC family nucleoid-associated protein [Coprobacillus sp.]|nr:YbaB/EbfC family nucleoid-associated protein [Coprobacillus sp.]
MPSMQQMLAQAQKMQREINKAKEELEKEVFTVEKNGIVKVTMQGTHEITAIEIAEGLEEDDREMLQDSLILAINELNQKIFDKESEIEERSTGVGGRF